MPRKRRFHDSRRPRPASDSAAPQQVDTKPGDPPKETHPVDVESGVPARSQQDDSEVIEPTRTSATDRA